MNYYCFKLALAFFFFSYQLSAQLDFPSLISDSDNLDLDESYSVISTIEFIEFEQVYEVNDTEVNIPSHIDNGHDFSLLLFGILGESRVYFKTEEAYFIRISEEETLLTGVFHKEDDPDQKLTFYGSLGNGLEWDDWSNQSFPTYYKDDVGIAGDSYLDWTFQIMESDTHLYGSNELEGTELSLVHAPTSYYYGAQIGFAANNYTAELGASCWFKMQGNVTENGQTTSYGLNDAQGDIVYSLTPTELVPIVNHYEITDENGNVYNQSVVSVVASTDIGCTNMNACNYLASATIDDGSCAYYDGCGVCGGGNDCESPCKGDFNADNFRSIEDLFLFLMDFGCIDECLADVDGDGAVNITDIAYFLSVYGTQCPE